MWVSFTHIDVLENLCSQTAFKEKKKLAWPAVFHSLKFILRTFIKPSQEHFIGVLVELFLLSIFQFPDGALRVT